MLAEVCPLSLGLWPSLIETQQSYIVRVMKDRRTMQHAELVSEVARQLAMRFQPKPIMVKLVRCRSATGSVDHW